MSNILGRRAALTRNGQNGRMAIDRRERRLRNVQTLALVGLLVAVMALALLLVVLGLPQPVAIPISLVAYLVGWRRILAAVRRRRERNREGP